MNKNIIVIFLIVLFPLSFLLFFGKALTHKFNTLPYYHPTEIFKDSVDDVMGKDYVIPAFSFKNYNGEEVTRDSGDDVVYLVTPFSVNSTYLKDITEKLLSVNFKYREESNIKIYCLNIDDPNKVKGKLNEFTASINSNFDNSQNFYVLSAESNDTMVSFITDGLGIGQIKDSPYVLLIDPNGQIRGRYHFRVESHVSDAMEDVALLRKEISNGKYKASKEAQPSH